MIVDLQRRFVLTVAVVAITVVYFFAAFPTRTCAEAFRFPEGKHGKGELRYINDLPVMILEGTPEEIGEQHAVLLGDSIKRVADLPKQLIKQHRVGAAWPLLGRCLAAGGCRGSPVDEEFAGEISPRVENGG